MPHRVLSSVLILNEVVGMFVYSIVSQMHAHILNVVTVDCLIRGCGQSCQAILV